MPHQIQHHGSLARWLPKDPAVIQKYHQDVLGTLIAEGVCTSAQNNDSGTIRVNLDQLSPVILKLKKVIEENAPIFRDFNDMFKQVKIKTDIKDYIQLLAALDHTITVAPTYNYVSPLVSGVPMYGILAPFCNTEAGYRAFTDPRVNDVFREVFAKWTEFLTSPASRNVLVTTDGGWFSPKALEVQEARLGKPFQDVWVCQWDQDYKGFKSWDDFFVRSFRDRERPVFDPNEPAFINNPCEAIQYRVVTKSQAMDEFWLKEMPYSLDHILNYDPLASQLVGQKGATVYQAMLSSLDYHRWHSPVKGRVVKAYVVNGTHYAARLDDDLDPDVISRSQAFVTAMSTRALIFIEAENTKIGLMCFVGVGLGEISTTKLEVKEGDLLDKGTELGSFHFGGSTHLLVFRPEVKLRLENVPVDPEEARRVNELLFTVVN